VTSVDYFVPEVEANASLRSLALTSTPTALPAT